MKIYEELKKDHRTVLSLLDRLIDAQKSDAEERESLVQQIRDELIPHSRAEEAVLYNTLRQIQGQEGLVSHSYVEHMEAETLLRGLQVTDALNIDWVNGAKKLKSALEHHIAEEEGKIFEAAQGLFSDEEAEAMAEVFSKMKPVIREQTVIGSSLDMIVNMMPERLRRPLERFTTHMPRSA